MNINVAGLLRDPVGATRRYTVSEPVVTGDPDLTLVGPITGTLHMTRTGRGVLVEGRLNALVEQPCGRCLEPARVPVDVSFDEEFFQTLDMGSGAALDVPKDDPAVLIDGHHEINLDELVRQYLQSAVPIRPLCTENCAGLCPQCGQNLNQGACTCATRPADDRWAVLGAVLKNTDSAKQ